MNENKTAMERIHNAFGEMPYGAMLFAPRSVEDLTLDDIANNLENLRDTLRDISNTNQEKADELSAIESEIRNVKSFLARFS